MPPQDKNGQMLSFDQLMWPTLQAIRALGGSATNAEILSTVIASENISDAVLSMQHKDTNQSEIEYRLAWARTYLKKGGAIDNSVRGVWSLTEKGESFAKSDIPAIVGVVRKQAPVERIQDPSKIALDVPLNVSEVDDMDWKERLLRSIKAMSPDAFERLSQRILRESGFKSVEVTGRSGDGGIDGLGVLQINLITFSIGFQCKRYSGSVGSPIIRDFRGALDGRCEKGLLITTGNFTPDAQREANRDGAKSIDLVDGSRLCEILKDLSLGVKTEIVEQVSVDAEWFSHF